MPTRPSVYIETTIVGHLTTRLPKDPIVVGQMLATRKWWDEARQRFTLVTSQVVINEISAGDPTGATDRLKIVSDLALAQLTKDSIDLADQLLIRHALPEKARVDAVHVAVAATNSIEYLMTWNCRHLANATMRSKINDTCRECGFEPPIICTPYELIDEVQDA